MDLAFGNLFFYYHIYRDICDINHELGSPFTPCLVENIVGNEINVVCLMGEEINFKKWCDPP